ncbi:MAG: copper resistance protein CopC [Alphaproteobacteria bacterium]|nr:copper resistance protein CopC [Alphaproteobacteria bacterium]
MRRYLLLGLMPAVVCSIWAWPVAAMAHAFLDHTIPTVGGTVTAAPPELRLFFSEPLEPLFSGIEISGTDGQRIAAGKATLDPRDAKQFVLRLPPLGPGHYRVHWHVVSVDTHPTQGDFTFEVRP